MYILSLKHYKHQITLINATIFVIFKEKLLTFYTIVNSVTVFTEEARKTKSEHKYLKI